MADRPVKCSSCDVPAQVRPEVFNTDQGSQFTSQEFTQVLQDHEVKISMDGKVGMPTISSWSGYGGR